MSTRPHKNERGFTLIEVLVALLIFSVGITGLIRAGTESARATFALEQKMLASIVADNALIERRRGALQTGERRGEAVQMGQPFDFVTRVEKTTVDGFYAITVTVSARVDDAANAQVLVARTAFRSGPS